jgi:hypothetical protein
MESKSTKREDQKYEVVYINPQAKVPSKKDRVICWMLIVATGMTLVSMFAMPLCAKLGLI